MNPHAALEEASRLISERGHDYGGVEVNFSNIAILANVFTGRELTAWDVAMLHVATKLARIRQSPQKRDSYLDAINYLAFAAELAAPQNEPQPRRTVADLLDSLGQK